MTWNKDTKKYGPLSGTITLLKDKNKPPMHEIGILYRTEKGIRTLTQCYTLTRKEAEELADLLLTHYTVTLL